MKYEKSDLLNLYKLKVEEHWITMFNPILKYLDNSNGKKILDIGCGSGELANELAKNALQVIGIDSSTEWIHHCNKTYKNNHLEFIHADAVNLSIFKDDEFDIVIMNMVLPNIYDAENIEKIFSEVKRITKKGGDFIFSDLHPLCVMTKEEGNRRQEYSKNFSYFTNGAKFSAIVKITDNKEIKFTDSHRTLNFYTNILSKLDIYIKNIIESNYPKNTSKKFYRYSFPEYIIFCCKLF